MRAVLLRPLASVLLVNHEERFERDVVRPFVEEYLADAHQSLAVFATITEV